MRTRLVIRPLQWLAILELITPRLMAVTQLPLSDQASSAFRDAWRARRRSLTATIVISLSLGITIGASTTVFGTIDALFFRRLSLPHAEQLVTARLGSEVLALRYADLATISATPRVPRLAGFRFESAEVRAEGSVDNRYIDLVTGNYFSLLGVTALRGRVLNAGDERDHEHVAVVSEHFWTSALGRRSDVLGRTMRLNDLVVTIVGVTATGFGGVHFARTFDIAVPASLSPSGYSDVGRLPMTLVGRLENGTSPSVAAQALGIALNRCCAASSTAEQRPSGTGPLRSVTVPGDAGPTGEPMHVYGAENANDGPPIVLADASRGLAWSVDFRGRYRPVLLALLAGVVVLLVTASANASTLLVAQANARRRDFAIRLALGATARNIILLLAAEAFMLALAAALCGLIITLIATPILQHWLLTNEFAGSRSPSWRTLSFAVLAAAGSLALVTLWPARHAHRTSLSRALTGHASHMGGGRWSADRLLVVAQVALSVVLVWSATLAVTTVRTLTASEGGYGTRDVLVAQVRMRDCLSASIADLHRCFGDTSAYSARLSRYAAIRKSLAALRGVAGVAMALNAPITRDAVASRAMRLPDETEVMSVRANAVTDGFFMATGIGLRSGREFDSRDRRGSEPVAIVSASFARAHWPNRTPIGQLIIDSEGGVDRPVRVIGVANDANYDSFGSPVADLRTVQREIVYRPLEQTAQAPFVLTLLVRTSGSAPNVASSVRRVIDDDAFVKVMSLTSAGALLDAASVRERLAAWLASAFGALALFMAGLGLYAVLSYQVAKRTKEIGIRAAVGAQPGDILRLVLRQTLGMLGIGAGIGVPCAVLASHLARAQFFGVTSLDWRAVVGTATFIALIGTIATWLPARRAIRVHPTIALRGD